MSTFNIKSILEMSREPSPTQSANYEPLDLSVKKVNSFSSQTRDRDFYSYSPYKEQAPSVSSASTNSSQLYQSRDQIREQDYWEKRQKNNLSAKKSREKKKQLEFQQRHEALLLEKENENLRNQLNECMCPQTRQVYNALWLATNMSAGMVSFGH